MRMACTADDAPFAVNTGTSTCTKALDAVPDFNPILTAVARKRTKLPMFCVKNTNSLVWGRTSRTSYFVSEDDFWMLLPDPSLVCPQF